MNVTGRSVAWVVAATLLVSVGCGRDGGGEPGRRQVGQEGSPADLVPNGSQPFPEVLAAGQPSMEQLEAVRDAGYLTVINLRLEAEPGAKREQVEGLGMEYVSLPIAGKDGLTRERIQELAWALEEATSPVLLHCGSSNRVGAMLALKAYYLDGVEPEAALALGLDSGLKSLESEVRKQLGL